MAIIFEDTEFCYYANNKCELTLIDSNDLSNWDRRWFINNDLDNKIIRWKEKLTHKWEGTFTEKWYPTIVVQDVTSGPHVLRSTVDCRALDGDGNIDRDAQNLLKENEKQRLMTEKGFTEV